MADDLATFPEWEVGEYKKTRPNAPFVGIVTRVVNVLSRP
jgi:hypothetical protein